MNDVSSPQSAVSNKKSVDGPCTDVLRLTNVCRSYKQGKNKLHILRGAELQIAKGEMVALVTPSGVGKSTLLYMAGLLEKPDSGEVFIDQHSTNGLTDSQLAALRRKRIGFVYQFHHLLPEFSAHENIVIPQLIAGLEKREAENRADQLLEYMRIAHRADHRPAELSGGEQQRVAIARAVANAPGLLLADEPTGNLDPETSQFVFDMLYDLARQSGLSALIATHNHDLARKMDRRVTLNSGQVVELK